MAYYAEAGIAWRPFFSFTRTLNDHFVDHEHAFYGDIKYFCHHVNILLCIYTICTFTHMYLFFKKVWNIYYVPECFLVKLDRERERERERERGFFFLHGLWK